MTPVSRSVSQTLRFKDVEIALDDRVLLSINESIGPGEIVTVMGPSGSGKSSLLAYVAGFLDPIFSVKGEVYFEDVPLSGLPAHQRQVGLLFQDALLFPHMSVGQNLGFAIPPSRSRSKDERQAIIQQALQDAGLEGMMDRDPATLSGGQKSRVALMRVLLANPRALLLDEPFSKLDTQLRDQIRTFVFKQAKRRELPVLLVTHDQEDADAAAGRIINLHTGV